MLSSHVESLRHAADSCLSLILACIQVVGPPAFRRPHGRWEIALLVAVCDYSISFIDLSNVCIPSAQVM